ncbi:MAG: Tol-Pal system beta propeller repeat protein TolB [Pseudomonadota bacterium]
MIKIVKFIFILGLLFFSLPALARIYIPIDQPSDQKFPIAICNLNGPSSMTKTVADVIRNDLDLSGYFKIISPEIFKDVSKTEGLSPDSIRFSFWTALETQGLVKGSINKDDDNYVVDLRLYDPYLESMLVGKEYTFPKKEMKSALREIAHRFSDEIMEALTGIHGIFNTKIAYTAVTGKGKKEIFIMDMDGENVSQVTNLKSISLSPTWSPDGGYLAFTSYARGNPDLYKIQTNGKGLKQLVGGQGSKITPSWSPNGQFLAFSGAIKDGDAELYTMAMPSEKKVHRLTKADAIDIAPTWSPGSNQIAFASERLGNLHLFKMNANGGAIQRLTFVGYQNDMPNWSPKGDKIAFAGRDMGTFDIFIMNPDGSNIQRLTIASGSNEHPAWSPDGRFITFSSTRDGGNAIYIMRADGSNQRRVSKGNGILPEWGPRVK